MKRVLAVMVAAALLALVVAPAMCGGVAAGSGGGPHHPVLVFVSDGMRQDLARQFVDEGGLPHLRQAFLQGATTPNGMTPAVPPNSAVGWSTLLTGAGAGTTGITNNVYHVTSEDFAWWEMTGDGFDPSNRQAQDIVSAAEAAGLGVAVLGWVGYAPYWGDPAAAGPVLDYYPDWLTGRGIVANYDVPGVDPMYLSSWLTNTRVSLEPAGDWTAAPSSFSPATSFDFTVGPLPYYAYVYDSSDDGAVNYDHVLIATGRSGKAAVAELEAGQWSSGVAATVEGWMGPETGGLYFKLLDLDPDLSRLRVYFTPVVRPRAWPAELESDLVARFDPFVPDDYWPYLAGLVDARTLYEQVERWYELVGQRVMPYIVEKYRPDLVLAGSVGIDSLQHRFLAQATPGTPVWDADRGPELWGFISGAYGLADGMLGALEKSLPGCDAFILSDHGFSSTWRALGADQVLQDAGLYTGDLATSQARAYVSGGTAQIYISLAGRNPGGVVPAEDYEAVRQRIVDAFLALGPERVERVLVREEAAAIDVGDGLTASMYHPERTGDVIVFAAPPYQFDAAPWGAIEGPAPIYGQHGFVPNGSPDRYATFVACGPSIRKGLVAGAVTAADIAPTVAALLGIEPPAQSEGRVLGILK